MSPHYGTQLPENLEAIQRMTPAEWKAILKGDALRARQWIQAAARLGHDEAQVVLGQWLLDGHGGPRDAAQALLWFLKAAEQKHAMGINMAGRCYENAWGTAADPAKAVAMYEEAAALGLDAGFYNLANQLASGKSVQQDHLKALELYSKAARLGHVKSLTKVGRYLEDGVVVEKNLPMALDFYRLGAEGGDFRGQFSYAGMLAAEGKDEEALHWLRKVEETATPSYLLEAGGLLQDSRSEAYRRIGLNMLAVAARRERAG
ncbi:MAG: tetratricopeptide repeat protein [Pseudomonadota bacterium]